MALCEPRCVALRDVIEIQQLENTAKVRLVSRRLLGSHLCNFTPYETLVLKGPHWRRQLAPVCFPVTQRNVHHQNLLNLSECRLRFHLIFILSATFPRFAARKSRSPRTAEAGRMRKLGRRRIVFFRSGCHQLAGDWEAASRPYLKSA